MRKLGIFIVAALIGFSLTLSATPAVADHGNYSPTLNRDFKEIRSNSMGIFGDSWRIGYTSMNPCRIKITNDTGYPARYSVDVWKRYPTDLYFISSYLYVDPGDYGVITVPGSAIPISREPYFQIYAYYNAGQGWHDFANSPFNADPFETGSYEDLYYWDWGTLTECD